MTKIIYNYHAETGEFLSQAEADESPLEPGVYLQPANSTDQKPPVNKPGETAQFDGQAWCLVKDVRGVWFDGSGREVQIDRINADTAGMSRTLPPSDGCVLVDGAWAFDAASAIASTLTKARALRLPILSVLDGMQVSAVVKGDSDGAQSIEAAKQGLKDITKLDLSACTSPEEMATLITSRYSQIASSLPPAAVLAFAQVLS